MNEHEEHIVTGLLVGACIGLAAWVMFLAWLLRGSV